MRILRRSWPGIALFAAGLGLMGIGAMRGEISKVLTKAIYLCLECVGIG